MRILFICALTIDALGQTPDCSYTLIRVPVGAIQVFRNGILLDEGTEYSRSGSGQRTIAPLEWLEGDRMIYYYSRGVAASIPVNSCCASAQPFTVYSPVKETFRCKGNNSSVLHSSMCGLNDGCGLSVKRLNPTQLQIGGQCSPNLPCNIRFGSVVYQIQAPATVTLLSGDGTISLAIDNAGNFTAAHDLNLSIACTGCLDTSTPGFPIGSIPLAQWSATSGIWNPNGAVDLRAFLSQGPKLSPGNGIVITADGQSTTISVDSNVVPLGAVVQRQTCTATGNCVGFDLLKITKPDATFRYLIGTPATPEMIAAPVWTPAPF